MKIRFLAVLFIAVLILSFSSAATLYENNPMDCPSSDNVAYPGISCPDGKIICGENFGNPECISPLSIISPSSSDNSSLNYTINSGFGVNCYYQGDFCYNAPVCKSDFSCSSVGRKTNCVDWGAFECSDCSSGRLACDGSYVDTDGCEVIINETVYPNVTNAVYESCVSAICSSGWMACSIVAPEDGGCTTEIGSSCILGDGKPGTWENGCVCNELDPENFTTNIEATGWGNFLLWGKQTNLTGWFMKLTSDNGNNFSIDDNGCIIFSDGSSQCSSASSLVSSLWNESGNDIYYTNGNVGIGTNNPDSMLHLSEENGGWPVLLFDVINSSSQISVWSDYDGLRFSEQGVVSIMGFNINKTKSLFGSVGIGGNYAGIEGPGNSLIVEGFVGIGTTTPKTSLEVNGSVNVSGVIYGDGSGLYNLSPTLRDGDNDTFISVEESDDVDKVVVVANQTGGSGVQEWRNGNGDVVGELNADGSASFGYGQVPRGTFEIINHPLVLRESLTPYAGNTIIEHYQNYLNFRINPNWGSRFMNNDRSETYFWLRPGSSYSYLDVRGLNYFYPNQIGGAVYGGGVAPDINISGYVSNWATSPGGDVVIDGGHGLGVANDDGNVILTGYYGKVGVNMFNPTNELTVNGTVNATAFVGDGSGLTGISGGIWQNVSGVAFYDGDVNVTGTISSSSDLNFASQNIIFTIG